MHLQNVATGNPGIAGSVGVFSEFEAYGSSIFSGLPSAPVILPGTYAFPDTSYFVFGSGTFYNATGPATLLISTSPSAPAPIAGGGLLAAFAALLGLGCRPLLRRFAGHAA